MLVVSFTQWGLDPSIASRFPNAAGRQRVDNAIDGVNSGLEAMAAAWRQGPGHRPERHRQHPHSAEAGRRWELHGRRRKISFLSNGDEPHHAKLADGGTSEPSPGGFMANHYFIGPLNAALGFSIVPLTENAECCGLRPTGTPAPSATPTRAPPTATAAPATATPVTAVTLRRRQFAPERATYRRITGDPALDANNWAIVWGGNMSPSGGYGQLGWRARRTVCAPRAIDAAGTPHWANARVVLNDPDVQHRLSQQQSAGRSAYVGTAAGLRRLSCRGTK